MSNLSNLGAALTGGGTVVEVLLPTGLGRWNEVIPATVRIIAGNHPLKGCEISVYVREHWTTTDDDGDETDHYRRHNAVSLATNIEVEPGQEYAWACALTIPDAVALSHDWAVVARLGVPLAVDREGVTSFTLLPPRAVEGLEMALCACGDFSLRWRTNRKTEVHSDFRPPDGLKKSLDGVKLIVQEEGPDVVGVLEINPQEKSLADRLKSLVRADLVKHPIRFPAAPLAASLNGTPVPEVVTQLRNLIVPHLD